MSDELKTLAAAYAEARLALDVTSQNLDKAQDEYHQAQARKSAAFYAFSAASDNILKNACAIAEASVDYAL